MMGLCYPSVPPGRISPYPIRTYGCMTCAIRIQDKFTDDSYRTLQQSKAWPMNDMADPTMGWDFAEILAIDAGNAVHVVYGKLYAHLGSVLSKFRRRLSDFGAQFELHNIDLLDLQDVYAPSTFDRIEVRTTMLECSGFR